MPQYFMRKPFASTLRSVACAFLSLIEHHLLECSLLLIVIGARLAVFAYAGSPLPYYDQWIAEFNNMLLRLSAGENLMILFDRHNEHVLATTKLLTWLGYTLNGYWDVPFLIVCSAIIRSICAVMTFRLLSLGCSLPTRIGLWLLCAGYFAIPLSAYNNLSGMQVSFYIVDLALLLSLHAVLGPWRPWVRALFIVGGTFVGLISMSSAIAIPVAILATHLCQHRTQREFWPAWTVATFITLSFGLMMVNAADWSRPSVLPVVLRFWLETLSWPFGSAWVGLVLLCGGVTALVVVVRNQQNRLSAALVGLGVYAGTNAALVAMARTPGSLHMRHWDTVGLIAVTVVATGLRWAEVSRWKGPVRVGVGIMILAYALQAGQLVQAVSWPYLRTAHSTRASALEHYRTLLRDGNLRDDCLRMNGLLEKKDYSFFDDPIGRFSLHPAASYNLIILQREPLKLLSPAIGANRDFSAWSRAVSLIIEWSGIFLLGGGGLVLVFLVRPRIPLARSSASKAKA